MQYKIEVSEPFRFAFLARGKAGRFAYQERHSKPGRPAYCWRANRDGSRTTESNDSTKVDLAPPVPQVTRFHKIVGSFRIPQVVLFAINPRDCQPDQTKRHLENH